MKHISVDELLRMRDANHEVSRELIGDFKFEPPHPAPWTVNQHASHVGRFRTTVYVIGDANRKCVAELTDRYTAEWLAREWNERNPASPQSDPKGVE
jgi:hypothetical protein